VAEKDEKKQPRKPNAIQRFWSETIGELRKVNWPTPKEAWELTKVVLAVLAAMSILLGTLDLFYEWIIRLLVAI
jgi:preprotein translocase subunit SecE